MHRLRNLSLQIFLGILLGSIFGALFKHQAELIAPIGQAYVLLLQMPILIFMSTSIIVGISKLTLHDAKAIFSYALLFLGMSWLITESSLMIIPWGFPPAGPHAPFASTQVVVHHVSLLDSFIPENPFKSFANGTVPAIVVFSIFFAIALANVKKNGALIANLTIMKEVARFIIKMITKFSFFGVFALSAQTLASIKIVHGYGIEYYYLAMIFASVFVSTALIPLLVSIFTPHSYFAIMRPLFPPLMLALVTGNVIITLPLLIDRVEKALRDQDYQLEKTFGFVGTLVPLSFNFPVSGKLLNILFVYFAGWHYGHEILGSEAIEASTLGLITSFGSPRESITLLLEKLELPLDALELFLPTLLITSRLVAFSRVASIASLCFFTLASFERRLTFKPKVLAGAMALTFMSFGLWFVVMGHMDSRKVLQLPLDQRLTIDAPRPTTFINDPRELAPRLGDQFTAIKNSKELRVGYVPANEPYIYESHLKNLVGLDMEAMHNLAAELDVTLVKVNVAGANAAELITSKTVDLVLPLIDPSPPMDMEISDIVLSQSPLVLLGRDNDLDELSTKPYETVAVLTGHGLKTWAQSVATTVVEVPSITDFVNNPELKVLLTEKPFAHYWSLTHPGLTIIPTKENLGERPRMVMISAKDTELATFFHQWLDLYRAKGLEEKAYKKWVLLNHL